jgi:hypothetical protein
VPLRVAAPLRVAVAGGGAVARGEREGGAVAPAIEGAGEAEADAVHAPLALPVAENEPSPLPRGEGDAEGVPPPPLALLAAAAERVREAAPEELRGGEAVGGSDAAGAGEALPAAVGGCEAGCVEVSDSVLLAVGEGGAEAVGAEGEGGREAGALPVGTEEAD